MMSKIVRTIFFCFRGRNRNLKLLFALASTFTLFIYIFQSQKFMFEQQTQQDLIDFRRDVIGFDKFVPSTCSEKINIVYMKMIKCASTTLTGMFRRFGFTRDLAFVLPLKGRIYLGWPYQLDDTFYRPRKTDSFNILCDHMVYNRTTLTRLMPDKSFYVTSLREPFSQVKSMLNYYNVFNISGVWSGNPLAEYLNNIEKYETAYKSHGAEKRYCIPDAFSMSKNLMSFNLGFPNGYPPGTVDKGDDESFINEWIQKLDSEMDFVMITEYFFESLVLLRRMLCWKTVDVLFSFSNYLSYSHRSNQDRTLVEKYKQWSKADFALYDHFNVSLWKRLSYEGRQFWMEVEHVRTTNQKVNEFCSSDEVETKEFLVEETMWNERMVVDKTFCTAFKDDLFQKMNLRYEELKPTLVDPQPSKVIC